MPHNPATAGTKVGALDGTGIALRSVSKDYGTSRVLHGIDLELAPGELVCLLGPSGCGKTTALRCLAGLEEVTSGQVLIDGKDVSGVPVNRRDIGMVFQAYSLFPHMTVAKNVEFGLSMRKIPRAQRVMRVAEALESVDLGGYEDRYAHQLSGGQQQRVALARALVTRPRALLLDEPLSALDAKVRIRLREQIRAIVTDLGITTVFVTHDQEEALAISDRVAVMNAGRIEQFDTPEGLYHRPATPFVADFVGISNRLNGLFEEGFFTIHGQRLPVASEHGAVPGQQAIAYVRPEHIRILPASDPGEGGLEGTVVSSGFLGSMRRTVVLVQDHDGPVSVAVQHEAHGAYAPGQCVRLVFDPVPVALEGTSH
ncbi:ABC transporter ATP-binding protein [Paeniglutamicibacter antarcticus]|uniref:ABC transporter ATP-binding protein n=1 Tax=Paeniglutamicibacter antarcticus TaxID=494023 RepID=A0ABP9THB3_9MICC